MSNHKTVPSQSEPTITTDFTKLPTPPVCVADFCLIPIGTPTASVSSEVAQVQRLLKKCGLDYSMHSAGTTVGMLMLSNYNPDAKTCMGMFEAVRHSADHDMMGLEGSWDDVMRVIGQCHAMLHERGVLRIQSDIRVGTRTDKKQHFEDKVKKVESLLAEDTE